MAETKITGIGNYYGGLIVRAKGDKYYWRISSHEITDWVRIPQSLYNEIITHNTAYSIKQVRKEYGCTKAQAIKFLDALNVEATNVQYALGTAGIKI